MDLHDKKVILSPFVIPPDKDHEPLDEQGTGEIKRAWGPAWNEQAPRILHSIRRVFFDESGDHSNLKAIGNRLGFFYGGKWIDAWFFTVGQHIATTLAFVMSRLYDPRVHGRLDQLALEERVKGMILDEKVLNPISIKLHEIYGRKHATEFALALLETADDDGLKSRVMVHLQLGIDHEDRRGSQRIETEESERIERLKELVEVSFRLSRKDIGLYLGLTGDALFQRLVKWAKQFGFKLDGEDVVFEGGRKDEFIAQLEKEFQSWGKDGKK